MLKTVAAFFIACAFFLGGMQLSAYYNQKVRVVSDVLQMLSVIESRLKYVCLPVTDLLRLLADEKIFNALRFIKSCQESVNNGEAFPQAWKNSVENDREFCILLGNLKNHFISFGGDLGATNLEGQLGCCEYYKQIFQKELAAREENARKYSKTLPLLGLSLGVSAAILIV